MFRADNAGEDFAMTLQRKAVRHFQRRPEFVFRARRDRISRAQNDVTGKRIALRHPIEGRVDLFRRHFPGDERAIGEIGREQRLPDAPDRARPQHRDDSLEHRLDRQPGALRDLGKRFADEAGDLVLGDGENARVDRVVMLDRNRFVRQSLHAEAQQKTARKWQAVPRSTNKCQTKCV